MSTVTTLVLPYTSQFMCLATLSEGQAIVKPCPLSPSLYGFSRTSMLGIEPECSDLDEGFFVVTPLF